MPANVFISYARLDGPEKPEEVRWEIADPVDRFVRLFAYAAGKKEDGLVPTLFRDEDSIKPGDTIRTEIAQAIAECPVMLAFTSKAYFASPECFKEWQAFDEARREAGRDRYGRYRKLLIPIQLRAVKSKPRGLANPFGEDAHRWYEELATANGRKFSITSEMLLKERHGERLMRCLEELDDVIQDHLERLHGTASAKKATDNQLRFRTPIVGATLKSEGIAAELRAADSLRYRHHLPVCVIYTGGTVGMVRSEDSDPRHADYEMPDDIDAIGEPLTSRLSALPVDVHLFRREQAIDSASITAGDWVELARLVQEQAANYQGFVILHGTNTLAYTASALSFLLSGHMTKPVILTGAEVPLSDINTDAGHNVGNAIRVAAHQAFRGPVLIREVCVYWSNHLYRGNRVTKKTASDRAETFHTPNMRVPLATLVNDKLDVEYTHVNAVPLPSEAASQPAIRDMSGIDVAILFIHPNMDFEQVDRGFSESPDGLILLSYGPGNVPDDPVFIAMLKRLIAETTIVANVTQCPYGRVELRLFETSATLFDLGVVDAYDMTLEAAYTKLLWALAKHPDKEARRRERAKRAIRREFQECRVGEMSASIFTEHRPYAKFAQVAGRAYRTSTRIRAFTGKFSRLGIAEAFIRIEGLRFPAVVERAKVRVYYGPPPRRAVGAEGDGLLAEQDNLLAEFEKTITETERVNGVDKNLEVTATFRKAFDGRDFVISIGVEDAMADIEFRSVRLVVYTKDMRRYDG